MVIDDGNKFKLHLLVSGVVQWRCIDLNNEVIS